MIFESGFNPVLFLYLNPQLNLSTVEQAASYSNSSYFNNIDSIPSALDPYVFISENRETIDISSLNRSIFNDMCNNGYTPPEIESGGVYFPTIYRSCIYIGLNTFKVNKSGELPICFSSNNLPFDDQVKIVRNNGTVYYGKIINIVSPDTFSVSFNGNLNLCDTLSSSYDFLFYGIKLYDPLRLARISYLSLGTLSNNVDIDVNFNYELYQMLYPDTRNLNKEEAFVDYTNRYGNNDFRIIDVASLSKQTKQSITSYSQAIYNELAVTQTLHLNFQQETGRVIWNGQDLYYATNNPCRVLDNVSPYFPGLITEYAIKKYIYNLFWPVATFSNVYIDNLFVNCDATFCNNVFVHENLISGRVGIGHLPMFDILDKVPVNLELDNLYVHKSFYSDGITQFGSDVVGNQGACFSGPVKSFKIGIGMDNEPNYSINDQNHVYCDTLVVGNPIRDSNVVIAHVNGIITATNLNPISDRRLKKNILPAAYISDIVFPDLVSYSYINDEQKRYGFVAQELEDTFPESVINAKFHKIMFKVDKEVQCVRNGASQTIVMFDTCDNFDLTIDDFVLVNQKLVRISKIIDKRKIILDILCPLEGVIKINGLIFNQVKMVDYTQILMALVAKVKKLEESLSVP